MATQRRDDHLDRRIPESQNEGTFDRDLHRTLDLTVGQVNELEEKVHSFAESDSLGQTGASGDQIDDLESKLSELEKSLSGWIAGLEEKIDLLDFEARDEVFTEPVEFRASETKFIGAGGQGAHTAEFQAPELRFRSRSGSEPFSLQSGRADFEDVARFQSDGAGEHVDLWAGSGGRLNVAPKRPDSAFQGPASSDVVFEADELLPKESYETSLGSQRKKYQSIHAAELWIESLVAQQKIATIGGSIFVGPTTELTKPLSGDPDDAHRRPVRDFYNYIRVKHNQMSPGDVVLMDNFTRVEFLRVVSGPTEIDAENPEEGGSDSPFDFFRDHNYRYEVERDLDGSGANDWAQGAAVANTGRKSSGFIDLYATRSRRAENESGPSMAISVREEDKSSYGKGEWAPGAEYKTGDIVYFKAPEWTSEREYKEGDVVFYPPDGTFYVANADHIPQTGDEPLSGSDQWSVESEGLDWETGVQYEPGDIVYYPSDSTYYVAQTQHKSTTGDEPLSGSTNWGLSYAPDWSAPRGYDAGDVVYYLPRDQHYISQSDHDPDTSDEPLGGSSKWSEKDVLSDTNFAAQADHESEKTDLPLGESLLWSEVDVTDYFNQWGERSAIGNLDGLYDYASNTYGVAGGKYENTWFSVDEDQGFRLMNEDTKFGQWDVDGSVQIGNKKENWIGIDPDTGIRIFKGKEANRTQYGQWGPKGFARIGETHRNNSANFSSQGQAPREWKGGWSSGEDYVAGDVVKSPTDGFFYIAQTAHTSTSGDQPIGQSSRWQKEFYPVEIAPNGDLILRGNLRIPDGSGGFKNPGIDWQGVWQPDTDYDQGDGVFYEPDGNTYVCQVRHTSVGDPSDDSDSSEPDADDEPLGSAVYDSSTANGPDDPKRNGEELWSLAAEPSNNLYLDTDGPRAIKNAQGTVKVIIRRVEGGAAVEQYTGSDFQIANENQSKSFGVSHRFGPDAVQGQKTLVLEEKSSGRIFDTMDVLDVTDGLGGGYVQVSETLMTRQAQSGDFLPPSVTLTGVFFRVGETTTPEKADVTIYPYYDFGGNQKLGATYTKDVNADNQTYPTWDSTASYSQGATVEYNSTHYVKVEDTDASTNPADSPRWAVYDDQNTFTISVTNEDGAGLNEGQSATPTKARTVAVEYEFTDPVTGDVISTAEEVYLDKEKTPGRFTSYVFARSGTRPDRPSGGGSYENPTVPTGNVTWHDAPPTGDEEVPLWQSHAEYEYSVGGPLDQYDTNNDGTDDAAWSEPSRADADSEGLYTIWAPLPDDGQAPETPDNNRPTGPPDSPTWDPSNSASGDPSLWTDAPQDDTYYMARSLYEGNNGWSGWTRVRIRGEDARSVQILADGLVFKKDTSGNYTPSEILLEAQPKNINSPTYTWSSTPVGIDDGATADPATVKITPDELNADGQITVSVDAQDAKTGETFTDKTTIHEVADGEGIQLVLENPNHGFPTNPDGSVADGSGSDCKIWLYEGGDQRPITAASIANVTPTGNISGTITLEDPDADSDNEYALYSPDPSSFSKDVNLAAVTVEVSADLKRGSSATVTGTITYTKSGIDAQIARIVAPGQILTRQKDGTLNPSDIQLEYVSTNIENPSPTWTVNPNSSPTRSVTTDTVTVDESDFSDRTASVQLSVDGDNTPQALVDEETLHIVREGGEGITVDLSNGSHTFDTREDGTVPTPTNGSCTFTMYQGGDQINMDSLSVATKSNANFSGTVIDNGDGTFTYEPSSVPQAPSSFLITLEAAATITSPKYPNGTTITRQRTITYTKAADARNAYIQSDDSVIVKKKDADGGKNTPVQLEAITPGLSSGDITGHSWSVSTAPSTTFTLNNPSGNSDQRELPYPGKEVDSVTVSLTVNTANTQFTDDETFPLVKEGTDGITLSVSNDRIEYPVNADGDVIPSLDYGAFTVTVYEGAKALSINSVSVDGDFDGDGTDEMTFSPSINGTQATVTPSSIVTSALPADAVVTVDATRRDGTDVSIDGRVTYRTIEKIVSTQSERGAAAEELGDGASGAYVSNAAIGHLVPLSEAPDHKSRWRSYLSKTGDLYLNDAADETSMQYIADWGTSSTPNTGLFAVGHVEAAESAFKNDISNYPGTSSADTYLGYHEGVLAVKGKVAGEIGGGGDTLDLGNPPDDGIRLDGPGKEVNMYTSDLASGEASLKIGPSASSFGDTNELAQTDSGSTGSVTGDSSTGGGSTVLTAEAPPFSPANTNLPVEYTGGVSATFSGIQEDLEYEMYLVVRVGGSPVITKSIGSGTYSPFDSDPSHQDTLHVPLTEGSQVTVEGYLVLGRYLYFKGNQLKDGGEADADETAEVTLQSGSWTQYQPRTRISSKGIFSLMTPGVESVITPYGGSGSAGIPASSGGTGVDSFEGREGHVSLQKTDTTDVVDNQLATTFPGTPPDNHLLLQHVFHDSFQINEVILHANSAPDSSYNISVEFLDSNGGSIGSYSPSSLSSGSGVTQVRDTGITQNVSQGDVIRVTTPAQDSGLEDLTVSFDMDSV